MSLRWKNTGWKDFRVLCHPPNRDPRGCVAVGLLPRRQKNKCHRERTQTAWNSALSAGPAPRSTAGPGMGSGNDRGRLSLHLGFRMAWAKSNVLASAARIRQLGQATLCSLFKEQLMRKQPQAGILGLRAIMQLKRLETRVPGEKVSS